MAVIQRERTRADRVAAFGAAVAILGMLTLPLAQYAENRISIGAHAPTYLWSAVPAAWVLLLIAVSALAASLAPLGERRGLLLKLGSSALVVALAWVLGATAVPLLAQDATGYARVSMGLGAWAVIVGVAVIDFSSRKREYGMRAARGAVTLAMVAGIVAAAVWGNLLRLSIFVEYKAQSDLFWASALQHVGLAGSGLVLGAIIGVPLGILASRNRVLRDVALGVTGVIQTLPSLALLGLLIVPLATLVAAHPLLGRLGIEGIGAAPAIIALTVYALLPVVRNTYVGIAGVDPGAIDAGRGMGMNGGQLLMRVQLPLAMPLVIEGLRAAAVLVIGIAVVTAFVGAGGLGVLIVLGLGQQAQDLILLGAIPVVILAVFADVALRGLARVVVSPGIRSDLVDGKTR